MYMCFRPMYFGIQFVYAKYTKLNSSSRSTFMQYLDLVTRRVEKSIQKVLPSKLGIINSLFNNTFSSHNKTIYSRTRIKETRIKETFGYKILIINTEERLKQRLLDTCKTAVSKYRK